MFSQNISLHRQYEGKYDFTAIGNTLNFDENGSTGTCNVMLQSSANLNISSNQTIEAAYLYWAGSGNGDFNVKINNSNITAQRFFYTNTLTSNGLDFFGAFADITSLVKSTGSGIYTFSDIALGVNLSSYCDFGVNFAGWSILVVYEDVNLPNRQISIFDGFRTVNQASKKLSFNVSGFNAKNVATSKIGFLVWDGDSNLAVGESLKINGNSMSSNLNPINNVFNGTNSYSGSTNLYNMDLDLYYLTNEIQNGDTTANIELETNQDGVIVHNIVLSVESEKELPDAEFGSLQISNNELCDNRNIEIDIEILNSSNYGVIPSGTPVAIFLNNSYFDIFYTTQNLNAGESYIENLVLNIPDFFQTNFSITFNVDKNQNGDSFVEEVHEENNIISSNIMLIDIISEFTSLKVCVENGLDTTVNLNNAILNIDGGIVDGFYNTYNDASNSINDIQNVNSYSLNNSETIFVKIVNSQCSEIFSFDIIVSEKPSISRLDDIIFCDNYLDFNTIPVSSFLSLTSNQNLNNYFVDFYETLEDSQYNTNNLQEYFFEDFEQKLYIKLTNKNNLDCASIYPVNFIFSDIEILGSLIYEQCSSLGTYVDLAKVNDIKDFGLHGGYDFYHTIENAALSIDPILDISNYNLEEGNYLYVKYFENTFECPFFYIVDIQLNSCEFFIPEGFSPNNDQINDYFQILQLEDFYPNFKIKIFSRYGVLVYKGDKNDKLWDGRSLNGKLLPASTYYYIIDLGEENLKPIKGWVYLNK
ncbi:gliding motility-associated C-terminal domain-containing protein [Mesonia phycicola]|nr:gliding motility-associated C-terminal domain-containing protein [Mesonia phycicola]